MQNARDHAAKVVAGDFDPFRILEDCHLRGLGLLRVVAGTFDPFRILEVSNRSCMMRFAAALQGHSIRLGYWKPRWAHVQPSDGKVAGTFDPFRILEGWFVNFLKRYRDQVAGTFDPFRILELVKRSER